MQKKNSNFQTEVVPNKFYIKFFKTFFDRSCVPVLLASILINSMKKSNIRIHF